MACDPELRQPPDEDEGSIFSDQDVIQIAVSIATPEGVWCHLFSELAGRHLPVVAEW